METLGPTWAKADSGSARAAVLGRADDGPEIPGPVSAFLTQLGIALHKARAYPAGHPMREESIRRVAAGLGQALLAEPSLRIGVGRRQLIVDGISTPPDHYVLRDLASRLNRRHVGALVFHAGAGEEDFAKVIAVLTADESEPGPDLEMSGAIELTVVSFSALSLDTSGEGASGAVDALWQDLARRALAGPMDPSAPVDAGTPSARGDESRLLGGADELARALTARLEEVEARTGIAETLESIARATADLEGPEKIQLDVRLQQLLAAMSPEALSTLLELDLQDREALSRLIPVIDWLPVAAAVHLVESASQALHQDISASLLRVIRKLAATGSAGNGGEWTDDGDLRSLLKSLLASWTSDAPSRLPGYDSLELLTADALTGPAIQAEVSDAVRLVQMSLEIGSDGEHLDDLVARIVESDDLGDLIRTLEATPPDHEGASRVWSLLTDPGLLRRALADPRLESAPLASLLARVPDASLPMLVELAMSAERAEARRVLLDRILGTGKVGAEKLSAALATLSSRDLARWLDRLAELPAVPEAVDVRVHLGASEAAVRLAAHRIALGQPARREEAIQSGLGDADERVTALVVEHCLERFPRQCLSRLMLLLNSPSRSSELKAQAVPILAQLDLPSVRQWLADKLVVPGGWFRRPRLVAKSPVVLARLRVLAAKWPAHPDTVRVLKVARTSADRDVRAAAGEGGPR